MEHYIVGAKRYALKEDITKHKIGREKVKKLAFIIEFESKIY